MTLWDLVVQDFSKMRCPKMTQGWLDDCCDLPHTLFFQHGYYFSSIKILNEKIKDVQETKKETEDRLTKEFENLANKILDLNSEKFKKQNESDQPFKGREINENRTFRVFHSY